MRDRIDLLVLAGRGRGAEGAPRPLFVALPQFGSAIVVLGAGLGAGLRWPQVLAVGGLLVLVGVVQMARAAIEVARRRRMADEWLLWGATARPSSTLLDWRARELGSRRLQKTLAHSLHRIAAEAKGRGLPGPVPLNRRAIITNLALVRAVCERLEDGAQPAPIRGVLLVDRLLTEPGSPLYSYAPAVSLSESLVDALAALDPDSLQVGA